MGEWEGRSGLSGVRAGLDWAGLDWIRPGMEGGIGQVR